MNDNCCQAGDEIFFGRYPQDCRQNDAPIAWRVLDVKEDRALLLSKDILDAQPFAGEDGAVFWYRCFLRGWLNHEFLPRAFSPEEIARIIQPEDTEYRDIDELLWEQFGMEDTTETIRDAVFLLSYEDILHYFPGENTLFCPGASAPGTEWARAQAETDDMCWWLRSASAQAGYVNIVSPVNSVGACIDAKETRHGVRPALWLKLDR